MSYLSYLSCPHLSGMRISSTIWKACVEMYLEFEVPHDKRHYAHKTVKINKIHVLQYSSVMKLVYFML